MSRLVIAANRGPVTLGRAASGEPVARHGAGGLAPSLAGALRDTDAVFVAAAMSDAEREAARDGWPASFETPCRIRLVELSAETVEFAYKVVANETLWFLHHGLFDLPRRPSFDAAFFRAFDGYRRYNAAFAQVIAEEADAGATVVVNDYHLALVGPHLARERPDLLTVHFSHTPFCTSDELSILPAQLQRELLGSLASFGACGFHTARWAERYRHCAVALGIESPNVFVAPLGIDAAGLAAIATRPRVAAARERLEEEIGGRRLVLRSDRVELSKNIVRGFLAFAELLETEPGWRGEVVFVARAYASRADLEAYVEYRREIEQVVAEVNGRFSSPGYVPVRLEIADDFESTVAAMSRYDVLVVNPVRDGMNLVAKEGPVLNRGDGVLVLSTEAGAYEQLSAHALGVNPFDVSATAAALSSALRMEPSERRRRAAGLRAAAGCLAPATWLDTVRGRARPVAR